MIVFLPFIEIEVLISDDLPKQIKALGEYLLVGSRKFELFFSFVKEVYTNYSPIIFIQGVNVVDECYFGQLFVSGKLNRRRDTLLVPKNWSAASNHPM